MLSAEKGTSVESTCEYFATAGSCCSSGSCTAISRSVRMPQREMASPKFVSTVPTGPGYSGDPIPSTWVMLLSSLSGLNLTPLSPSLRRVKRRRVRLGSSGVKRQ